MCDNLISAYTNLPGTSEPLIIVLLQSNYRIIIPSPYTVKVPFVLFCESCLTR